MPTAQLVYDDRHQPTAAIEYLQVKTGEAYAAIHQQVETALRIELAKLAPQDRRLFRAELAEVRFGGTDSEPCTTDVCDACHPEAWA